ncbi:Ig-like domain-containing protein [Halioxenophilus aromaticivorans]|uniref:Uncharacterized protein n=2 Tax=Halioxenophilus aromaticivorans TaxID=1306992 RepID=A0AAV3U9E0_9ALTE
MLFVYSAAIRNILTQKIMKIMDGLTLAPANVFKPLALSVLVLGLSACGGSGGGSTSAVSAQQSQTTASGQSPASNSGSSSSSGSQTGSADNVTTAASETIDETSKDVVGVQEEAVDTRTQTTAAGGKPKITMTAPADGAVVNNKAQFAIKATAWDNDGAVDRVTFFVNNQRVGSDYSQPFTFTYKNAVPGRYKVYAMAHDDKDLSSKSSVHWVTVKDESDGKPTVSITSPGDVSDFVVGKTIQITAAATDSDGSIKKVEFFSNGEKLGSDANKPYQLAWADAEVGSHDIHVVATDNQGLTAQSDTHRVAVNEASGSGKLVTYPASDVITQKFKSNRFGVKVTQNGATKNSFVYEEDNSSKHSWAGNYGYMQEANHWTTFSFSGAVNVEASRLDGKKISSCVIRPKALKINPTIAGNKCSFRLNKPVKVSVEIDETSKITQHIDKMGQITKKIVKHPLFVFADAMEQDIPKAGDKNVVYFKPGIHEIGKQYQIPNNTTVYIAGGAYVIGSFTTKNKNPSNVTIRGRGILSGGGLGEGKSEKVGWKNHAVDFSKGRKGKGLVVEGITITDPLRSCILSYSQVDVKNTKLFSWRHRNDGIVAGNGSLIENNFLKVQDDNIKLYYGNQTVRNNVIWQQTSGAVFKFAWDLKGVSKNIKVSNIDIIHSDVFFDYAKGETDRPELNSTSAVFSAMGFGKNAAFRDNSFQNIRIEEENLLRLMALRMVSTHHTSAGKSTWGNPNTSASKTIENITIDNLSLAGVPYKQSTFYGNKGGAIKKIAFSNLRVDGQLIANNNQLTSRLDGVGLKTVGNVSNISISP